MNRQLSGRSIVVTGAARGIGRAIAEGIAAAGALVTVADIDLAAASAVAEKIRGAGGSATAVHVDVSERATVRAMIDAAITGFGALHGIVNNAGIAQTTPFLDITDADWQRIMRVNSLGVMICMQEAARRFIAQGHGGKIVNMASVGGKQAYEPLALYCASKFSVIAFTQAGARAFGKHRINVNAICPGVVATDMWRVIGKGYKEAGLGDTEETAFQEFSAGLLLGRASVPEDLVGISLFLLSEHADYMTGQSVIVDGGMVLD